MDKVSELLPVRIEDAVNELPVCMLAKEVDCRNIEAFLAVELSKLQSLINVDERLNLQSHQIPIIAQELLSQYRNETLADFVICFKRGAMGRYDEKLLRVDGAVIFGWMRKYLEEKYQVIESNLMKEKENPYEVKKSGNGKGLLELLIEATGYKPEPQKPSNEMENEFQRKKLTDGRKAFTVGKITGVYAKSQEQANEIVEKLIRLKELPEGCNKVEENKL